MYPNTEFFLVRIFPHSDWIRRDTKHTSYLSVLSPNVGKYGPEKTPIWTLFTQWVWWALLQFRFKKSAKLPLLLTCLTNAWNVSKYGVFSGPYSVRMRENTDQKKFRFWKHFTQWTLSWVCFNSTVMNKRFPFSKHTSHTAIFFRNLPLLFLAAEKL